MANPNFSVAVPEYFDYSDSDSVRGNNKLKRRSRCEAALFFFIKEKLRYICSA